MQGEAARWRERRDNYVSLGMHPKIAGALAWQWLDGGPPPETLTEALDGSHDQTTTGRRPVADRKPIAKR